MSGNETVKRPMESPVSGVQDREAQLRVLFPTSLARIIRLERRLLLGRQPDDDDGAPVADGTVSRRHAEITWSEEAGSHAMRDLGSSNGSRVDGVKVGSEPVPLVDSGVVRVGDVLLIYERPPSAPAGSDPVSRDAIAGNSSAAVRLRAAVAAAAADPSPVLLIGETGTGKEYIAREIHRLSGRSGSLVAVNCAALSPQLVESQLFGHRRGAFTGAERDEVGLFRAAEHGTLFLDEIGELPLELQPKLLRVLQEGEVMPVGATQTVPVDVRVIAATLRDLPTLIDAGTFRLDLYARLSPWEIQVPPLRARRGDLITWIERIQHDWQRARNQQPSAPRLEVNALERLLVHDWPDNLRGIHRLVHRMCSRGTGAYDLPSDWTTLRSVDGDNPPATISVAPPPEAARQRRSRPSREDLQRALEQNGGSVRATAKALGRERRLIYRWMELYGLRGK